jgi:hypothetical protein
MSIHMAWSLARACLPSNALFVNNWGGPDYHPETGQPKKGVKL